MTDTQLPHRYFGFGREDLSLSTEADLLAAVRAGRPEAFGELWVRHEQVALAVARNASSSDPDDLVAEAFARVLRALRRNKGPRDHFRGYLCATVRACAVDEFRRPAVSTVELTDPDLLATAAPFGDDGEGTDDVRRAWEKLSRQHQWLLWAHAVEGYTLAEMAEQIGARPGTVAVWLFRAREHLRAAFLDGHVDRNGSAECDKQRARFVGYLRGTLGTKRRAGVEAHLEECTECAGVLAAAGQVNHKLRVVIWPVLPLAAKVSLAALPAQDIVTSFFWQHAWAGVASAKVAAVGATAATVAVVGTTAAVLGGHLGVEHREGSTAAGAGPALVDVRAAAGPSASPTSSSTPTAAPPSTPTSGVGPSAGPSTASATPGDPTASLSAAPGVVVTDPRPTPAPDSSPLSDPGAAGAPAPPPPCAGQLLVNSGFEDGTTGWSAPDGDIWSDGQYSRTGQGWAWIDGQPVPSTESLWQTVSLPAGCSATLTYWLSIATAHTGTTPIDTLTLEVNGTRVQSFSNTDEGPYVRQTVDLSSYAGQDVTICWTGVQTTSTGTSFWIDDTSLVID